MAYSDKVNVLHSLANTLRRAGITDKVTIIAKAKVPIVKFVTTHGRFAVDISINQINGVAAITLVNTLMRTLPALRALVLVVKAFLSQRAMNEVFTGGLGSYSVVCLAASFLQQHPKARRGELDPSRNLGVLVVEFFEFYGLHFNYQEVGISLRDGGTYYSKSRRGWADYKNSGLLSIEDPTDPCRRSSPRCSCERSLIHLSERHLPRLVWHHARPSNVSWCIRDHARLRVPARRDDPRAAQRALPQSAQRLYESRRVEHHGERDGRHAGGRLSC
jgi:DNA polymerase sigma